MSITIGTTNTGNVCRLAFKHPNSFAAMLGVEVDIVRHYSTLLTLITTPGVEIDADAWDKYCNDHLDTYYYNNEKYSWLLHTPTVCILLLLYLCIYLS